MMDLGAVQTHYAAVEFVQQPTTMAVNTDISPSGMVSVTENGSTALNVPVTLTLAGPGALAGTTTAAIVVQPGIMAGSMNGPILAYRIPLAYPAGAKSLHMRGDVVLHAVIDKQGRLAEIQPVGGQAVFVDSAVRAVSQ